VTVSFAFAARLRALRQARLLSQTELAALIGSDASEVSRWETGTRRPHPRTMRRICDALGVEPSDLLPTTIDGEKET
jgi:transcriptional regulator with XRE-family HTH domain